MADTESRAMAYASEFRTSGLKAARGKRNLDVVCTGYDSPETKKTLALIRKLGQ